MFSILKKIVWIKFGVGKRFTWTDPDQLVQLPTLTKSMNNGHVRAVKLEYTYSLYVFVCQHTEKSASLSHKIHFAFEFAGIRLDPKTASCVYEIDKIYKDLCILWKLENNQSIQDNPNSKPNQPYCSLCLHDLNASYVQFSSNLYHSTCINYWLNCVDPNSFPNLRVPWYHHHVVNRIHIICTLPNGFGRCSVDFVFILISFFWLALDSSKVRSIYTYRCRNPSDWIQCIACFIPTRAISLGLIKCVYYNNAYGSLHTITGLWCTVSDCPTTWQDWQTNKKMFDLIG